MSPRITQFEIGPMKNFVYVIEDEDAREAAIIDPQEDLTPLLQHLKQRDLKLRSIFLTHTHFDHTAGVIDLMELFPSVQIFVHRKDLHRMKPLKQDPRVRLIDDGELLTVGTLQVQVIHTPGHSAGECCFFLPGAPPVLFTGDTVFIRDCGRTDFADGSNEEMFASIQKLKALPPQTIIYPGHHYAPECSSTLDKEMRESPPFLCRSVEELANLP